MIKVEIERQGGEVVFLLELVPFTAGVWIPDRGLNTLSVIFS